MDLKEPTQSEAIRMTLKTGMGTEFWDILCQAIDESIERLRAEDDSEISEKPAEQYKLENELNKAKIRYLKKLRSLPDEIINDLERPEVKAKNYDPYSDTE